MYKNLTLLLFFFLQLFCIHAQELTEQLNVIYDQYKDPAIRHKKFKPAELEKIILGLKSKSLFDVNQIGTSFQNRSIYLVKIGKGPIKVLLWSQMHGDESTATMAIVDLFKFFLADDKLNEFRHQILSECTFYFIPMLNPDGAELFVRRNAQLIDINRDALFLQSPEARLLKRMRDSLSPDFGFNLHDQSKYYTAGNNRKAASISLLAPAYNLEKEVNPVREKALLLIGKMHAGLQKMIPDGTGRYDDEFEPRAFGDNIQKWGTSTILIETGAFPNDPEKQFLRKVNFILLLEAFQSIRTASYKNNAISDYWRIPENKTRLNDFIIRNITLEQNNIKYQSDISFNYSDYSGDAGIADMGDLSVFNGYSEWDGTGKMMIAGKIYHRIIKNTKQLKRLNQQDLLNQGFTDIKMKKMPAEELIINNYLNILPGYGNAVNKIALGNNPNAIIMEQNKIVGRLINGRILMK